ncbi:unnamed protein product, partial [Staurois parvus]
VALQGRVAVYKRPPRTLLVRDSRDTVQHRSSDGTSVRGLDHVITDWPISDHMQSSKQDHCVRSQLI